MHFRHLILAVLCATAGITAETVVKNSAPFQFPVIVGVANSEWMKVNQTAFSVKSSFAAAGALTFSWSVPQKAARGSIALFTISGVKVKTVAITKPSGLITLSNRDLPAAGIYFAKLSFAGIEKTSNFVVY